MLLAFDLHKDFIDVEGVTVTSVFSFQATCKNGTELDAPKAYRFSTDGDTSFSEVVFNIAMAQVETIVEPDRVGNVIGWGAPSGNRWRLYVFIRWFYKLQTFNLAIQSRVMRPKG